MVGKSIWTSPALTDFNNDGYLEIVVSTLDYPYSTYVFDYQGNILPGWPQYTSWNDYRSPIIGDVNGDGVPDIITTAGNGFSGGGVYAWNLNGTLIEGFPKVTEVDAQASATIADIDNNGRVELIASSNWDMDLETGQFKHRGSLYVWELDSGYNSATMRWPTFHHDNQRTGLYSLPSNNNISSKTFTVYNDGNITLDVSDITIHYKAGEPTGWISGVTPTSSSISPSSHRDATVTIDVTGLSHGTYHAWLLIYSNDPDENPYNVTVNLTCGGPVLSYSPTYHDFGTIQEGQTYQTTFDIWNCGTGTLDWSLSDSYSWLTYSPTSGSSTGEHDTVTVTIDTTGLSPGSYSGSISISSNGGSGTFTVTFTISSSIWSASITAEEMGGSGETFTFGEDSNATDGDDGPPLDIEHAPYPPPDLVIYSLIDGTKYSVDTKYGPDTSKTWDV